MTETAREKRVTPPHKDRPLTGLLKKTYLFGTSSGERDFPESGAKLCRTKGKLCQCVRPLRKGVLNAGPATVDHSENGIDGGHGRNHKDPERKDEKEIAPPNLVAQNNETTGGEIYMEKPCKRKGDKKDDERYLDDSPELGDPKPAKRCLLADLRHRDQWLSLLHWKRCPSEL